MQFDRSLLRAVFVIRISSRRCLCADCVELMANYEFENASI